MSGGKQVVLGILNSYQLQSRSSKKKAICGLLGGLIVRLMPKASEEQGRIALSFWASRHQEQGQGQGGGEDGRGSWAGLGLLGAGLVGLASSSVLSAEEKKKMVDEKKKSSKLVFGKTPEDRIRQYATADNVFDHFASYQLISETGTEFTNQKLLQYYFE